MVKGKAQEKVKGKAQEKVKGKKMSALDELCKDSQRKRLQRRTSEYGNISSGLMVALISLGAASKLPTIAASDVMALYAFSETLIASGFNLRVVAPLFLVAHHVRCPRFLFFDTCCCLVSC